MHSRQVVKILKELAQELQFELQFFCDEWVIQLKKNNITSYIFGYDWEINATTAQQLAKDKAACFAILQQCGVEAIPHQLFLGAGMWEYSTNSHSTTSWESLHNYAKKYDYQIVVKNNGGTGGNEVFKINTPQELELQAQKLFAKYQKVCASPFYEIHTEYRAIVFKNEILAIYAKQKPFVTGNGKHTILQLILQQNIEYNLIYADNPNLNFNSVPANDSVVYLTWKHNLAQGATPLLLNSNHTAYAVLSALALQAAQAIGIQFASVDIATYAVPQQHAVMEINGGIMLEKFAQYNKNYYIIAKNIYKKAVINALKLII